MSQFNPTSLRRADRNNFPPLDRESLVQPMNTPDSAAMQLTISTLACMNDEDFGTRPSRTRQRKRLKNIKRDKEMDDLFKTQSTMDPSENIPFKPSCILPTDLNSSSLFGTQKQSHDPPHTTNFPESSTVRPISRRDLEESIHTERFSTLRSREMNMSRRFPVDGGRYYSPVSSTGPLINGSKSLLCSNALNSLKSYSNSMWNNTHGSSSTITGWPSIDYNLHTTTIGKESIVGGYWRNLASSINK